MRSPSRHAPRLRAPAMLATALSIVAFGHVAHAGATDKADPAQRSATLSPDTTADGSRTRLRPGVLAGIGFPRPIAVEGLLFVGGRLAVGLEYGALPSVVVLGGGRTIGTMPSLIRGQPASVVSIDGVRAAMWSLAGDCRWFPFGSAFYVGLRAGRQHVDVSTNINMTHLGSTPETLALDSWYVNPRIGLLWAPPGGLAFGLEAGLQIPLEPTVASTLPLSLDPAVRGTAAQLGSSVIPTIDLLRLGIVL